VRALRELLVSSLVFLILLGLSLLFTGVIPAQAIARPRKGLQAQNASAPWIPPASAWRIAVETDGLYQMTYDDLAAAGLPVDSLNPRTFRMFYMGQELPIFVDGEEDGSFDAGDAVLFYGRDVDDLFYDGLATTNRYTGASIYWLSYGGADGLRMTEKLSSSDGPIADVFPHRQHLEGNTRYLSAYPFREGADHWYWEWIRAQGRNQAGSRQHDFDIQHLAAGAYTATLTTTLLGYADGPHHLSLYINDTLVFDDAASWNDYNIFTATAPFSQSLLQEGTNVVKVEIRNDGDRVYDEVYLNWIELSYFDRFVAENNSLSFDGTAVGPQQFRVSGFQTGDIETYDVSDDRQPQRIAGATVTGSGPYAIAFGVDAAADGRYLTLTPAARLTPTRIEAVTPLTSAYTPVDLLDAANGADYILISHADFWNDAQRLTGHRAGDYRVALVDVQSIYDQFNGGMMSAEAIRDFLAYAYANWTPPAPQFVTLLGDGSWDMRHYGNATDTFIPPYLALADPTLGETAADNRFVTLVGDDPLPDIAIGRLPANTPDEARAMVDKIITYETGCHCGDWSYNTIFMSDNQEGGGGNFYDFSDRVADGYEDPPTNTIKYLPDAYDIDKLYMGLTCDVDNPPIAQECTEQLTNTLNITGALFVSYVGHATKTYWAKEHLWDQSDAASLQNGPCLPIMLAMTCFEGSFQDPTQQALGEYQVRLPEHGAVASWSSTGNGLATGHDVLEKGLMLALFHKDIKRLGAAASDAKRYLWNATGDQYVDLIETYTLLGDAALKPKTDAVCQEKPTAVMMANASVTPLSSAIRLSWRTADEHTILAFNIWRRSLTADDAFARINGVPIFARGRAGRWGASYRFVDRDVSPDVDYKYRLQILQLDGGESWQSLGVARLTPPSFSFSSP